MGERIMRPQSLYILWALLTMHYNSPWICSSEDLDCRMGLRRSPILLTFEMYVLVRRVLLGVHSPSVPHPLDSESQNHTNSFYVLESPYAFFGHSTNPFSTFHLEYSSRFFAFASGVARAAGDVGQVLSQNPDIWPIVVLFRSKSYFPFLRVESSE